MNLSFAGKTVLITGAAQGIGAGIARCFAQAGANLILHAPSHEAVQLHVLFQELENINLTGHCQKWIQDFAEDQDYACNSFISCVDVLVNNAGVTPNTFFGTTTPKTFDTVMSINFKAGFFLTREFVYRRLLNEKAGSVLFISSVHALMGFKENAVYAASKGAITSCIRHLAVELGPSNIRVNAIAPGYIDVPRHHTSGFDQQREASSIPLRRLGTPEDIGNLAVFLASDQASYITGQTMVVDGGSSIKYCMHPDE